MYEAGGEDKSTHLRAGSKSNFDNIKSCRVSVSNPECLFLKATLAQQWISSPCQSSF